MGTWIEIKVAVQDGVKEAGRSLRGNVDRNISIVTELSVVSCRSLRGNVDRNLIDTNIGKESWSRSLRGNVDRNRLSVKKRIKCRVVPYVGTWIEMLSHLQVPE